MSKLEESNFLLEYDKWEEILKNDWLPDIDKEEWFINKWVSATFLKIRWLLEWNDLNSLISKIERDEKVNIYADYWSKKITIVDQYTWNRIWKIYNSTYKSWKIEHDDHLYLKVEDEYRKRWFWYILFWLYEKMWDENWKKLIPNREYSRRPSRISFSENVWYDIVWKINLWTLNKEDLTDDDYYLINNSKEDELPFDVILERK